MQLAAGRGPRVPTSIADAQLFPSPVELWIGVESMQAIEIALQRGVYDHCFAADRNAGLLGRAAAERRTPHPALLQRAAMELRPLAKDVYACLQEDRGLGCSNSGLVNRAGGLVIDTFWDLPHTRQMIDLYSGVWREPAKRVLNTHANGDHCWGNQLFRGAELIGHRECANHFTRENPKMMQMLKGARDSGDAATAGIARALDEWDFSGIELTPPTRLFDDRLDLDLDGTPVQMLYVGPAHTDADVIAWLPEQRVLFTGDVLFRLCTPIGWEGTYERWITALDAIIALRPEIVVPGHGPICGTEGPREMRDYLQYVRAESKRFFDQDLTALEAAKRIDLGPYAGWTEPERLIFNVERAYREFRGEPWNAPVEVTAMFQQVHALRQHMHGRKGHA